MARTVWGEQEGGTEQPDEMPAPCLSQVGSKHGGGGAEDRANAGKWLAPALRSASQTPHPVRALHAPLSSLRLALVDSDREAHTAVGEAVTRQRNGWLLHIHPTPHAVRRILRSPWWPDVVLMDPQMRGLSMADSIRKMRDLRADLPILIFTARSEASEILGSLIAGASGYLIKPVPPLDLEGAICKAVAGRFVLCPEAEHALLTRLRQVGTTGSYAGLSEREQQVVACLVDKLCDKEIGRRLGIETNTVHAYLKRLFIKLGVHSRAEAVRKVFDARLRA